MPPFDQSVLDPTGCCPPDAMPPLIVFSPLATRYVLDCLNALLEHTSHADLALTEAEADVESDGLSSNELLIAMRGVDIHEEFADDELRELVLACV
jgi:hypothetical protein